MYKQKCFLRSPLKNKLPFYIFFPFLSHKLLDALDLPLKASFTQCFDCLPNSDSSSNHWCGQGPCHTCGFFSVSMVIVLHIWAGGKEGLVLMSACHRGCKDITLVHFCWPVLFCCFFLSNSAFECPTGWTLNSINLHWDLILESLANVSPFISGIWNQKSL